MVYWEVYICIFSISCLMMYMDIVSKVEVLDIIYIFTYMF